MFLTKKIVVLNGKVSGSVKISKIEKDIEVECKLSKIASADWMLAILNNGKTECFKIDDCNKKNFKNTFDLSKDFICLILPGNFSEIIARGSNGKNPNYPLALISVEEKMNVKKTSAKKEVELSEIAQMSKVKTDTASVSEIFVNEIAEISAEIVNENCDCAVSDAVPIPLAQTEKLISVGGEVEISLDEIVINADKDNQQPFFLKVQEQIQTLFETYPINTELEDVVKQSRWVNISYAYGHYVLGVICEETSPIFICYGVPCEKKSAVSGDMANICQWVPLNRNQSQGRGYYMIYQDANSGEIFCNQD